MRHDLLNPAGNVKGYSDLLLDTEASDKQRFLMDGVRRNNDKLIEMIETAAKFAKLESVTEIQFEVMDIGAILRNVAGQFDQKLIEKQMTLEMKIEGTYHSFINPIAEEIFANFISNSIKYSPEGTSIIVEIIDSDCHWKVKITDQGEGIPDDLKVQVFDRFKRVHKKGVKGTGLGLAIVKRIVEIMDGEVGVEDNPLGQGSVFWVKLKKEEDYARPQSSVSEDDTDCISDLPLRRQLIVH
jgi:signal transduction histidine kinase